MGKKELINIAKAARINAYAPYSGFKVGAAILTKEGKVFSGCNIENTSLGLSLCAERIAIIKAISEGYQDFSQLVVVVDSKKPCSPCGICRQVIYEFDPDLPIVMVNLEGKEIQMTAEELLPAAFEKVKKKGSHPKRSKFIHE